MQFLTYGSKLENYPVTIKAVTYNIDGSVKITTNSLKINGNKGCDLDGVTETDNNTLMDFYWERRTDTDTYFLLKNGAAATSFTGNIDWQMP